MLYREWDRLIRLLLRLQDLVLVAAAFVVAIELRKALHFPGLEPFDGSVYEYWGLLLLVMVLWERLLTWNKMYVSHRGRLLRHVFWIIFKVNIIGLIALGAVLFFEQEFWIHRTLVLLFVLICTAFLILERVLLYVTLRFLRKKGRFIKYAIIVGTGDDARWLLSQLSMRNEYGIDVIGFVQVTDDDSCEAVDGVPVLGSLDDMLTLLEQHVVDEVFIASSLQDIGCLDRVFQATEEFGVNTRLLLKSLSRQKAKMFVDEFINAPFIGFSTTPLNVLAVNAKLVLDVVAAFVLLLVLSPVLLFLPLLIKLDSPGPVIFKQDRAGKNGRIFKMLKFRTMVVDAESRREEVDKLNTMNGPLFKAQNDPRVTRIGKVLRKTSLDELPQLFNVLIGEMSLVGPRPLPVYESRQITGGDRRRLSMKPGITGLWQVSGRSDVDFEEWMRMDMEYIDNWSFWMDIRILLKTAIIVLSLRGAY